MQEESVIAMPPRCPELSIQPSPYRCLAQRPPFLIVRCVIPSWTHGLILHRASSFFGRVHVSFLFPGKPLGFSWSLLIGLPLDQPSKRSFHVFIQCIETEDERSIDPAKSKDWSVVCSLLTVSVMLLTLLLGRLGNHLPDCHTQHPHGGVGCGQ